MGIRVHKVLGYGLTDIVENDPRIDWATVHGIWESDKTRADYAAFLEARQDRAEYGWASLDVWAATDKHEHSRTRGRSLEDCVTHRDEYGLPNVFVVQPLAMHDWSRQDDHIDYMAETFIRHADGSHCDDWIHEFGLHGLYPFNALYWRTDTWAKVDDSIMWWIRAWNSVLAEEAKGRDRRDQDFDAGHLDEMAQRGGFADHDECLRLIACRVPDEIHAISEFLGIFTDDDAWRQLRPLLYTYWG